MAEVGGDGSSELYHSIPRGGPLYLSDLVGSLTNPPSFRNHLLSELQVLFFTFLSIINQHVLYRCVYVMQFFIVQSIGHYMGSCSVMKILY